MTDLPVSAQGVRSSRFLFSRALRSIGAALASFAAFTATPASAVEVFICWIGNAGYTMTGRMEFPDALAGQRIIREDDVTAFEITGFHEGRRVGYWNLEARTDSTSWLLQYDTQQQIFPLVGLNGLYQMWNANGYVDDCGKGGFGFNSGNGGQDVCIDNTYIATSTIDWDTPIRGLADQPSPSCAGPELIGALPRGFEGVLAGDGSTG